MKQCVVLGKANAGKTLFVLSFAAVAGCRRVEVILQDSTGRHVRGLAVEEALVQLVGPDPHRTRQLQSLQLQLPARKGKRPVELVDTPGLVDGIHPDGELRRAMARTLAVVRTAQLVLHVVDAARAGGEGAISEVDHELARFGKARGAYAVLANKMDLPGAGEGLRRIRLQLPGCAVLPVSALKREGFGDVRRFVLAHL